jgi:hypothetical protein
MDPPPDVIYLQVQKPLNNHEKKNSRLENVDTTLFVYALVQELLVVNIKQKV